MKKQFSKLRLGIMMLLILLENRRTDCFQRLLGRKLTSNEISSKNFDDIRDIVSASLAANEPRATLNNNNDNKRDTSSDQSSSIEIASEDNNNNNINNNDNNVASESKDASIYDDENEEEQENDEVDQKQHVRQLDVAEYKRSPSVSAIGERVERSIDKSEELANYDEPKSSAVKDVSKREARNEYDDYDEQDDTELDPGESVDSSISTKREKNEAVRSTQDETNSESDVKNIIINPRDETRAIVEYSDLDYEKQIEEQIQQRIDTIKDDIKREIERKQQVREIEANNAKYDKLEFPREDEEKMVAAETPLADVSSKKRSLTRDDEAISSNESNKSTLNVRSKRRSEIIDNEVAKSENAKDCADTALPVKKRSYARRMTLVEKRNDDKRERKIRSSSMLIPERGHAEVKDDLPSDIILDPNLRIARRSREKARETENLRSAEGSWPRQGDEYHPAGRYRRDMTEELEDKLEEIPVETSNFLFEPREKFNRRAARRRRSRDRDRTRSIDERENVRKHPRRSRRHRAIRESSMENANHEAEERDKRSMLLDEDAALEYKESFGGLPSESGGALGRFKRIKRSSKIS